MPARFLVVLDADSTLIRNEVIELLADEAGRGAEVAAATEAATSGGQFPASAVAPASAPGL